MLLCQGLKGRGLQLDVPVIELLERTGGSTSGGKGSWRASLREAILGILHSVIRWERREGQYMVTRDVSPLLSFATPIGSEEDPLQIRIREVNRLFTESVENGVPVDLRRLRAVGSDMLAWDLLVFLSWRVRGVREDAGLLIRWEWLQAQLGSRMKSRKMFRLRVLKALEKVQELYPELKAVVAPRGLVLYPSPPIFEVPDS